jgi:hypothetical protein
MDLQTKCSVHDRLVLDPLKVACITYHIYITLVNTLTWPGENLMDTQTSWDIQITIL